MRAERGLHPASLAEPNRGDVSHPGGCPGPSPWRLTPGEWLGAALMLAGVMLGQSRRARAGEG